MVVSVTDPFRPSPVRRHRLVFLLRVGPFPLVLGFVRRSLSQPGSQKGLGSRIGKPNGDSIAEAVFGRKVLDNRLYREAKHGKDLLAPRLEKAGLCPFWHIWDNPAVNVFFENVIHEALDLLNARLERFDRLPA